jgi:iron(III) transport system substrate-binding protein
MVYDFSRRTFISSAVLSLVGGVALAETPPLRARFAGLYAAASKEGRVVYYTSSRTEEATGLSAYWKANFPNVRLDIVAKSAPDLITQIEAEKSAGQNRVDVATITQPYVAVQWKAQGLYTPYKVAAASQLGDYTEPDGSYYVTGVYLLPPAYNTSVYPRKAGLPKKLADFLDPSWNGKLVIADPATAGNSLTFFLGMLQLGKIDWAWFDQLGKQNVLFVSGNPESARMVASGERPLAPIVSTLNSLTSKQDGQAIDFFTLPEGTVVAERPSGIMSNAPNPNAARLLLEVLTSAEGQQALAGAGMFWPTNTACPPINGLPVLADLNPVRVNLAAVSDAARTQAFLARFDQAFGRS